MSESITELQVDEIVSDPDPNPNPNEAYTLQNVDSDHKHYQRILTDFQSAKIEIVKVERLENPMSKQSYTIMKDQMIRERGTHNKEYKLNERYLYHGSCADEDDLCEQGLDDKLSENGCFGKGIYFSDDVRKCLKYASRRQGDTGLILCVRAILGHAKVYEDGEQKRKLKREPAKPPGSPGHKFFCSVKGRPKKYNEFVVYRKMQTLIEYLITYKKTSQQDAESDEESVPVTETESPSVGHQDSDSQKADTDTESDEESDSEKNDTDTDTESDEESDKKKGDDDVHATEKKKFKEATKEEADSVVNSFLEVTGYDLDIAIDLYNNRDKIKEEIERMRTSANDENEMTDEAGADVTFHPEGIPHYDTDQWKPISDDDKQKYCQQFLSIFMSVIALEAEHSSFAEKYLVNNNYDIDKTILSYYGSI